MKRWSKRGVVLSLAIVSGCICPLEKPSVDTVNGRPEFTWQGGGLARICVTDPGIACPSGENDTMPPGEHAYWFVSARGNACFPGGIQPPVVYGVDRPNNCMTDETAANGGDTGGTPLVSGHSYRVGMVGFGSGTAYQTFVAP